MTSPPKDSPIARVEAPTPDGRAAANGKPPPLRAGRPVPGISRDQLRAFLGRPSTQERIRRIVKSRAGRKTPRLVVDEMIQEANIAVMTEKWAPRSLETARGWIATVTVRAMVSYLRRGAKDPRWITIEQEGGESLVAAAGMTDARPDRWLTSKWLGREVMRSQRDQETLEILVYKARTGNSDEELADEHAMTVAALRGRVHHFKEKYRPHLRRRRAMIILSFGGVILALAAWAFWRVASPSPAPASPRPAPVVAPPAAKAPKVQGRL